MAHTHDIRDDDTYFIINPLTKSISTDVKKPILTQYSHNSERYTFEIPRIVEGHDMSLSDKIRVHYTNTSSNRVDKNEDVYEIKPEDIAVEDDVVCCTWLISQNATKYAGTLSFAVWFTCYDEDNTIVYHWGTNIYNKVKINPSLNNSETVIEQNADIIEQIKDEIGKEISGATNAVKYTEQTLTEQQQAQARDNIGAANNSEVQQLSNTVNSTSSTVKSLETNVNNLTTTVSQVENTTTAINNRTTTLENTVTNLSGTVEITSDEPVKEKTVLTIDPEAEEVDIYTVDEVDEKLENLEKTIVDEVLISETEPTDENVDLWVQPSSEEEVSLPEIKDDEVSAVDTWSSQKINAMFTEYVEEIADLVGGDA